MDKVSPKIEKYLKKVARLCPIRFYLLHYLYSYIYTNVMIKLDNRNRRPTS
jgi:hypothetical protein